MKKTGVTIIALLFVIMLISGCSSSQSSSSIAPQSQTSSSPNIEVQSIAESSSSSVETDNIVYLEFDPLPDSWHGEWICVYSEANYFAEGETIFVKDYDNAFLFTEMVGDTTYEENRWFCYAEVEQIVHIFNEPPPFDETWIRDSFEIKSISDSELVLSRVSVGQEVRFEKAET